MMEDLQHPNLAFRSHGRRHGRALGCTPGFGIFLHHLMYQGGNGRVANYSVYLHLLNCKQQLAPGLNQMFQPLDLRIPHSRQSALICLPHIFVSQEDTLAIPFGTLPVPCGILALPGHLVSTPDLILELRYGIDTQIAGGTSFVVPFYHGSVGRVRPLHRLVAFGVSG